MKSKHYHFPVMLIDVARNSTDDFNLFHDKVNWSSIEQNPFHGPIALGFQLLGLVNECVKQHREENNELTFIEQHHLKYSYLQIKFAQVVKPEDDVVIEVKKTQQKLSPEPVLSNRFSLKSNGKLALIGFNKASQQPLILADMDFSQIPDMTHLPDRSFTEDGEWFIKHKFFTTSNAKNFLVGCQVEQANYFDEINDKVHFPEIYPLALSSCALLERATKLGHDFKKQPMVYVSQEHCIDRELLDHTSSNDKLSMIVIRQESSNNGLEVFHCYGLLTGNVILFRSILSLAPMSTLIKPQ